MSSKVASEGERNGTELVGMERSGTQPNQPNRFRFDSDWSLHLYLSLWMFSCARVMFLSYYRTTQF